MKSVQGKQDAVEYIAAKLNKIVNVPIVGEQIEHTMLKTLVQKMFELLENFLPKEIYTYINDATEGFPGGTMNKQKWIDYITDYINENIDIPFLNEEKEEELIEVFVSLVLQLIESKDNKKVK